METYNLGENTLVISEDDYCHKLCSSEFPYHVITDEYDCSMISLSFYKELLNNKDYFQQLVKIFANEDLDFSICFIDFENYPCFFDTFSKKSQLAEGLKMLYDEIALDNTEKKKCEDLINRLNEIYQANSATAKYKCSVDNKEYELNLSTIYKLINLSEEELKNLCNSEEYKTIEGIPKEVVFYIVSNYFDSIKDQSIISKDKKERLDKMNSYQYIDYQALNEFLTCEDTIYKNVHINEDLRKEILEDLPEEVSNLEKAIYIYIKMCKVFSYDDEYYAVNQIGPLAAKHKNIEYINQLSKKNKKVVCYEFNAILTKFLFELGINFKSHYDSSFREDDYGNSHVSVKFRSSKFLVRADGVTSILNGDMINAKLNQHLCGLKCLNQNKKTQEEFASLVEKMYNLIISQEKSKSYLDQDMTFEDIMNSYNSKTNNLVTIPIEERIELLAELIDDKNLLKTDSWGYMINLVPILFTQEELGVDRKNPQVGIAVVGNNIILNEEEHVTTSAIIWLNNGKDGDLDKDFLDYYIYNPKQSLKKNNFNEMLNEFKNEKYFYLNEEKILPYINNKSLQEEGKLK